jgi:hypothetical protein
MSSIRVSRGRIEPGRVVSDHPGNEERSRAVNEVEQRQQQPTTAACVFAVKANTDVIGRRPAIDQRRRRGRRRMAEKIFRRRPRGQRNSVVAGQEMQPSSDAHPHSWRCFFNEHIPFETTEDEHFSAIIESFCMQIARWRSLIFLINPLKN